MEELSAIDILPEYPSKDDPEFAAKIAALAEFEELTEPFQKAPNTILYNHQETAVRFFSALTPFDKGIIIHDPGLGKTCTAGLIAEAHKNQSRKMLVITKNKTQVINFITNLTEKCTDGVYTASRASDTAPVAPKRGAINSAVNEFYRLATLDAFSAEIRANFNPNTHELDPSWLSAFDNTVVIVDEAHHIHATRKSASGEEGKKNIITDEALIRVCGGGELGITRSKWMRGVRESYRAYFLFLHSIRNGKIFFLTATPMVDRKVEAPHLLNLLLPVEDLFVSDTLEFSNFYRLHGQELLEELYPRVKGIISYARAKYRAQRIDVGDPIGVQPVGEDEEIDFTTRCVVCPMSQEQFQATLDAIELDGEEIDINPTSLATPRDPEDNSFMNKSRSASCMVFPWQGRYVPGNEPRDAKAHAANRQQKKIARKNVREGKAKGGKQKKQIVSTVFDYYIEQNPNDGTWQWARGHGDAERDADIEYLVNIISSLSFDGGLPSISSKYYAIVKELLDERYKNDVPYIYSPILEGSGLIALILCLKEHGFVDYRGESANALAADKSGARRIALIQGKTSAPDLEKIKTVLNDPRNIHGDLIFAVLGSPKSGESISFLHVRRVIKVSPHWNATRQVDGRAFRLNAHEDLERNGDKAYVRVINYAATAPDKEEGDDSPIVATPDLRILMTAEAKDREIHEIERGFKQCSFDGMVNKKLNQRPNDIQGTPDVDYSTSPYPIIGGDIDIKGNPLPPQSTQYKNRDLYYDLERTLPTSAIVNLLRTRSAITLQELFAILPFPHTTILFALDTLLVNRATVTNIHGESMYIKEYNNLIFLQGEYRDADPLLNHYAQNLYLSSLSTDPLYFAEASAALVKQFAKEVLDEDVDATFDDLFLLIRSQVAILFEGVVDKSIDIPEPQREQILSRFRTTSGIIASKSKKGLPLVYHRLYYVGEKVKPGDTAYARGILLKTAQRLGRSSRLRVYGTTKNGTGWRYATPEEDTLIVAQVNKAIQDNREAFSSLEVYGILYPIDNQLYLVFPTRKKNRVTKSTPKRGESRQDKRFERTGGRASTANKSKLVWVLWLLSHSANDASSATYPEGYTFDDEDAERAKRNRKFYIEQLSPAKPKDRRRYSPSEADGVELKDMDDERIDFIHYFFIRTTYEATIAAGEPRQMTLVSLITERLRELGWLIEG
jgi:hypothetical protein